MISINVPQAYKRLVILLAHMFYSGQCPPTWWIDAAEGPKKDTQTEELLEDKRAAQLAREAKRKAQASRQGIMLHSNLSADQSSSGVWCILQPVQDAMLKA